MEMPWTNPWSEAEFVAEAIAIRERLRPAKKALFVDDRGCQCLATSPRLAGACLMGVLSLAETALDGRDLRPMDANVALRATTRMRVRIPDRSLTRWNDRHRTTRADELALLRAVAAEIDAEVAAR